jgi:mono/diheme cytochrome c family protein
MRLTRWFAITLVSLTLIAAAVALAATTTKTKPASTTGSKVERGRYLVSVIGCNDCHTPGTLYGAPDMTRFLSGSELGWPGPWGTVYAANLTSDNETGLGKWTEVQIVTAIRTGNRPDGRQLAPIMPWMNLSKLSDADAHAIAAYLETLPPIVHKAPAPVPPGPPVAGAVTFPPPSEWDARNLPKPPGGNGK